MEEPVVKASASFGDVLGSLDFASLTDNFMQVMTISVPVIVGVLALRKGFGWLMGMIKRA